MDERLKELIAVGASAAVNCHPCLQLHLDACDRLGIDRAEARAAAEVGLMVNRGAAAKSATYVQTLFGGAAAGETGGCGCG